MPLEKNNISRARESVQHLIRRRDRPSIPDTYRPRKTHRRQPEDLRSANSSNGNRRDLFSMGNCGPLPTNVYPHRPLRAIGFDFSTVFQGVAASIQRVFTYYKLRRDSMSLAYPLISRYVASDKRQRVALVASLSNTFSGKTCINLLPLSLSPFLSLSLSLALQTLFHLLGRLSPIRLINRPAIHHGPSLPHYCHANISRMKKQ